MIPALLATLALAATPAIATRVVDGDTLHANTAAGTVTVRVIGIDTPETVKPHTPIQPCGPEASARAKELMPRGTPITLTPDLTQDRLDRYGRTLVYVMASAPGHKRRVDVGRTLIQEGLARVYVFRKPFVRLGSYQRAQAIAQRHHRGLWGGTCSKEGK